MDISNLTFDELLDAIRSDSGYQSALAKKESTAKVAHSQQAATADNIEPAQAPANEIIAEPHIEKAVYEPIPTPENTSAPVAQEPISLEPEEEADTFVPLGFSQIAEPVAQEPISLETEEEADAFVPLGFSQIAEPVAQEPISLEPEEEADAFVPLGFYRIAEPVAQEPINLEPEEEADAFVPSDFSQIAEPVAQESISLEPEEEADAFVPSGFSQIAEPVAQEPISLEPDEDISDDSDEVIELVIRRPSAEKNYVASEITPSVSPNINESDSVTVPSFYQPVALSEEDGETQNYTHSNETHEANITFDPVTPAPTQVVPPEENDEEPVKTYTPPTPSPIDFGRFDLTTDISSLFPDVTDEPNAPKEEMVPEKKAPPVEPVGSEKTRVITPTVETEAETTDTYDKTRMIEPAVDDKTKHVTFSPVYERPGIVTTSNAYDKTSDLNALPHILPADELIDGEQKKFHRTGEIPKVEHQPKPPVVKHYEEEQMVLPGFFELEEVVRVNEAEIEEELKRTRSKKVNSFRLEGADIEEPSIDEDVSRELANGGSEGKKQRRFSTTKTRHRLTKQRVEFTKPSDAKKVHTFIARNKLIATISTAVTTLCALILLITTGITPVADSINSACAPINGAPATHLISLVFLCVSIVAALPACISGITCFFNGSGKPNAQTPVIIAAIGALIQNSAAIAAYDSEDYPVFSLAAVLLLCCSSFGNILIHSRTLSNFAFLFRQGKEGLYGIRTIDNAIDANRVSQNVVMGDADIRYSGKLKFATKFMSYSLSSNSTDDLCAKLVPASAIASIVIGVIAGIVTKSFAGGLSLFSGALCMSAPACAFIAANLPLLIENKKLIKDGAMITSYAAAFEYESTNAIALDASDLFPSENCNIHGMKTFNGLRVDDAVLTAASMLIAAGGPVSGLFENVIMEHNELLLAVEDLKYEERLGLTGWIRDRRIFVGNRKLLENHNIEIPMSVDESKYARGDRQIIYLADAGKLAAFFVVSYGRNKKIAEYLRHIENNGINILVRTTDSNINEKFIAKCFDLPLNSVKVVSNTAGEVLKKYAEHTTHHEDAKLIHNGKAAAFLHAVSAASKLCSTAGKISTLQTFCTAAGLLLTLLIMIFSGPASLTALHVCICQIIWVAIAAILPLFGKE